MKKVLVVEDDAAIREMLRFVFETANFEYFESADEESLEGDEEAEPTSSAAEYTYDGGETGPALPY